MKPTAEPERFLHLHLRAEYFDAIKAGTKKEEFRLHTGFYTKRLSKAPFAGVVLYRRYPKAGDESAILRLPWRGFRETTITHPHFGPLPVQVYAINVRLAAIDAAIAAADAADREGK